MENIIYNGYCEVEEVEEVKSLDYLEDIMKDNGLSKTDLADILDNIGYILSDNGYHDARFFLNELSEKLYEEN